MGKFLMFGFGKMIVNTNVRTPIITMGFSTDHKTPKDMFRYRIRKSLRTRFSNRKIESPRHMMEYCANACRLGGERLIYYSSRLPFRAVEYRAASAAAMASHAAPSPCMPAGRPGAASRRPGYAPPRSL